MARDRNGVTPEKAERYSEKEEEKEEENERKSRKSRENSGSDSEEDRRKDGKSRRKARESSDLDGERRKGKSRRRYGSEEDSSSGSESEYSDSQHSGSDSESESSGSEESESESERRRRKRKEKKRRREKEEARDRKVRRREKERKRRRREREEERKKKEKRKKKKKKEKEKRDRGKTGAVTNLWGKYGIIRETDMWNKRPEFTAWLAEVKQVNLESLPNWEEKQMFKEFMEDHNTATFTSKKYYNLDAYFKRKMEKEMKRGYKKYQESERTVFNDEEQRRAAEETSISYLKHYVRGFGSVCHQDRTSFFKAQDVFVRCLLFWFSITWRLLLLHSWSPPHVVLFEKRPAPCCPVMQNCKCHATKTRIYPSRPNLSLLNRGHRSIIEDLTSRRFTLSLFLLLSPPHPTRSLVVACVNLKSETKDIKDISSLKKALKGQELLREREKQKEAEVESLMRSMQGGMAQAMKEQAQLREEMAYQYKLGNFEAAAAIQRRLDPDVAM
ncbi:hypothetical protein TIFTF001_014042 [Ficus carica]|uniref:Uncharacterized protein n=1 Tax=Ficus carica TaxID=3494 RepID=A0AA88AFC2_FICCA|nr:hypothetical protein TIFTF001_014042 [Ficus carica]